MHLRRWLPVLGYGALAATLLACLWLISLAPLRTQWGRELTGAAIAIVAMAVGLRLAQRPQRPAPTSPARPPAGAPDGEVVDAPPPVAADAARPDAPSLSVREREVLRLLAQGLSNKELARALSVSENTVKTHLANLYAKLGVGRRTEALAIARRFGLDA
jgi:DNA-binding CsgD family transcriptional regulator